jgi:hypothetical protein
LRLVAIQPQRLAACKKRFVINNKRKALGGGFEKMFAMQGGDLP